MSAKKNNIIVELSNGQELTFSRVILELRGIDLDVVLLHPTKIQELHIWEYAKKMIYANGDEDISYPSDFAEFVKFFLLCHYLSYAFGIRKCMAYMTSMKDWEMLLMNLDSDLLRKLLEKLEGQEGLEQKVKNAFVIRCLQDFPTCRDSLLACPSKLLVYVIESLWKTQYTIQKLEDEKKSLIRKLESDKQKLTNTTVVTPLMNELLVQADVVFSLKRVLATQSEVKKEVEKYNLLEKKWNELITMESTNYQDTTQDGNQQETNLDTKQDKTEKQASTPHATQAQHETEAQHATQKTKASSQHPTEPSTQQQTIIADDSKEEEFVAYKMIAIESMQVYQSECELSLNQQIDCCMKLCRNVPSNKQKIKLQQMIEFQSQYIRSKKAERASRETVMKAVALFVKLRDWISIYQ